MLTIDQIVAIMRDAEVAEMKQAAIYFALLILVLAPIFAYGLPKLFKRGLIATVVFVCAVVVMATKPTVQWDDYIEDSGTNWATNGFVKVGVDFRWRKTRQAIPDSQALYISMSPTNSESWTVAATTTIGASAYRLTLADPEAYKYYVWHEWMPPTPVHTNGVWLGTFIEKAKGSSGTDKMIIIHGQLQKNGKVIAP